MADTRTEPNYGGGAPYLAWLLSFLFVLLLVLLFIVTRGGDGGDVGARGGGDVGVVDGTP